MELERGLEPPAPDHAGQDRRGAPGRAGDVGAGLELAYAPERGQRLEPELRGTLVEVIREAEHRGVAGFTSAGGDPSRVTGTRELAGIVERVQQVVPGSKDLPYVLDAKGIRNATTGRMEYLAVVPGPQRGGEGAGPDRARVTGARDAPPAAAPQPAAPTPASARAAPAPTAPAPRAPAPAPELTVAGHSIELQRFKTLEHGKLEAPRAVVLHRTAAPAAESTLNAYRGGQQTGAHFLVAEDGKIIQTASLERIAWHVGTIRPRCLEQSTCAREEKAAIDALMTAPGKSWGTKVHEIGDREIQKKSYPDRFPINSDSIGIEIVGKQESQDKGYAAPTKAQVEAVRALVEALKAKYGLADADVYRHGDIAYKDRTEGQGTGY